MMMRRFLLTLAGTLFSLSASARAAIVISGDVATVGAQCTLTVTQDITWNASIGGAPTPITDIAIVFDNWLTTNMMVRGFYLAHEAAVNMSVNGQSVVGGGSFVDERGEALHSIGANDSYLDIRFPVTSNIEIKTGDQITLKAGVYQFTSIGGLNPAIEQPFTGDTFLTDTEGDLISNVAAAPEAYSCVMATAAAGAFLVRRRR